MDSLLVLLVWAVLGLAIGAAAKWIMPGSDPGGFIVTALLGIAGALVGGFLAGALGLGSYTGFTVGGLLIAVLGAILLLAGYRLIRRNA